MTISVSNRARDSHGPLFRFVWASDGGRVATIEYCPTGSDVKVMDRELARVMYNELLESGASIRWGGVQEVPTGGSLTEEVKRAIHLLVH